MQLATDRLLLRPLGPGDAAFLYELMNQPSWLAHIGDRGIRSADDAENYIVARLVPMYEQPGMGLLRVQRQGDDAAIGICGLLHRPGVPEIDLGFALLEAHEGRGYAREAASASVAVARDELRLGVLAAFVAAGNVRSQHLLSTLGFRQESLLALGATRSPAQWWRLRFAGPPPQAQ